MKNREFSPLFAASVLLFFGLLGIESEPIWAQHDSNVTAEIAIDAIDSSVGAVMEKIGASAASVAILREGQVVYSKAYGHSDRRARTETNTNTIFRLASCSKPFTAAATRLLIEQGALTESTRIYEYLKIEPKKELADPRIKKITIKHLLEHSGGWDRNETFSPLYRLAQIEREIRASRFQKKHIVQYMWQQPLQFDPGSQEVYSNFGYLLLGLAIEKATGKSYIESIRELIAEPLAIDDLVISSEVKRNRKSKEVHYPSDNKLNLRLRDASSGLATSPESLCKFMNVYYLDGSVREGRAQRYYYQFGSHPNTTTALMEQRPDGIAFAILLNRRVEETYLEDNAAMREALNAAIDRSKSQLSKD